MGARGTDRAAGVPAPRVDGLPPATSPGDGPQHGRRPSRRASDHDEAFGGLEPRERIAQLVAIIELAPVGIGVVDLEGRAPLTNSTLRRLLGYSAEEFARRPFSDFSHPVDNEENLRLFKQLVAGETEQFTMEKRFFRADGHLVSTELTVSLMRDDHGAPAYAIGMVQDISDRKLLEAQLRAAEEHYRLLVERVPAVVYTAEVGPGGRWHYVSPQIEALLGYTPSEWTAEDSRWWGSILDEDRAEVMAAEDRVAHSPEHAPLGVTYRLRHRDGRIVWVHDAAVSTQGHSGTTVLHGVLLDVTQEKTLEEALARQAIHDPLTGLVNRAHFRERCDVALAAARERGSEVGVLFIDLDGFKAVNDVLGHGTGDQVLAAAARRLAVTAADGCVVARLGGDEFAVLVEGRWAGRLQALSSRLLAALSEPVVADGEQVYVGASIGGVVAGPTDTTDTLLHHADRAMYRAKADGGMRFLLHGR